MGTELMQSMTAKAKKDLADIKEQEQQCQILWAERMKKLEANTKSSIKNLKMMKVAHADLLAEMSKSHADADQSQVCPDKAKGTCEKGA